MRQNIRPYNPKGIFYFGRREFMKRILFYIAIVFAFSFVGKDASTYRSLKQNSLHAGEKMEYRVHYGMVNAADAVMEIDNKIHWMNKRPCFKVNIHGKTTGFFDMLMNVDDTWGSYIDTSAIVPQRFYRYIEEGRYKKKEIIDFHHRRDFAVVHRLDKHSGKLKGKERFPVPNNVQDLVSGYYYLRTFNFDTIDEGEVFNIVGFFDDTTYHMDVRYLGMEKIKTKIGEFDAYVISPIMPENKLFSGKNPVRAWLSADKKKIPLRITAELLIGSLDIDIKSYRPGK